jgi:hypothetical protein
MEMVNEVVPLSGLREATECGERYIAMRPTSGGSKQTGDSGRHEVSDGRCNEKGFALTEEKCNLKTCRRGSMLL